MGKVEGVPVGSSDVAALVHKRERQRAGSGDHDGCEMILTWSLPQRVSKQIRGVNPFSNDEQCQQEQAGNAGKAQWKVRDLPAERSGTHTANGVRGAEGRF